VCACHLSCYFSGVPVPQIAKHKTFPLLLASSTCQPSHEAFSRQPHRGPGRVGFVVDEVVVGQVFLQVLRYSSVSITSPMPNTRSSTTGVV